MLEYAYANFGGYFWMIAIAAITYLLMMVVKKTFTPLTKKLAQTEKSRRFINAGLGVVFSIATALLVGKLGNFLFATDVQFMWFVAGGALANYVNLIVHKYQSAEASAFAKAFINACKESHMDVSEEDLPIITEKVDEIVKIYAEHNENSRRSKLRGVASGITGSVEITDDEQKELERHINAIKSSGKFEQSAIANLDAAYAKAKADGKITVAEKANLEAVIRAIHNATNI